jgi:hypothetical protein
MASSRFSSLLALEIATSQRAAKSIGRQGRTPAAGGAGSWPRTFGADLGRATPSICSSLSFRQGHHPETRAETQIFTITRRDRNRPFTLAEALDRANDPHATLLVNAQSGRAAVQVPALSLMLDDGEVERRVRLLRPMERPAIPLSAMAQTHWQNADRADFVRVWETEIAALPAFTDSNLHIVTGLLLPIWKRLPDQLMRVYRLQTDDGERVIGQQRSRERPASPSAIECRPALRDYAS